MTLRVIGAGTGRTGTTSLKHALEDLGFGPCYHMLELLQHPERVPLWEEALAGRPVDWDALFEGYQSTTDFPAHLCYRELMAHYPDARVILTVRDPDAWHESAMNTIYRRRPPLREVLSLGLRLPFSRKARHIARVLQLPKRHLWQQMFQGRFEDRAFATDVFRRHNQEVQETVPADRLLVFDVKQGWEPLCKFLDVPVPDAPFPRSNNRATFQASQERGIGALLKGDIQTRS